MCTLVPIVLGCEHGLTHDARAPVAASVVSSIILKDTTVCNDKCKVQRSETLLHAVRQGVSLGNQHDSLSPSPRTPPRALSGPSPTPELLRVKPRTPAARRAGVTHLGGSSVGFWFGSFRARPAGFSSVSVLGRSSKVISTLPCEKATA